MNDFFGKEIKVGDVIELRENAFDEGSCFEKGIVKLDNAGVLALSRCMSDERPGGNTIRTYYATPLAILEMSNDIVKVESE